MVNNVSELSKDTRKELEGWTLISPDQQKARSEYNKKSRKQHKEKEFVFMKKDFLSQTKEGLNLGEVGLLLFLARYMEHGKDGKLVNKTQRITVSEVGKLIGKKPTAVRKALDELEKRSLLFRVKEGRSVYVELSQDIFTCGSLNGEKVETVKVFKVKLAEVAKKLSLNELGLFMLMLENMHWKTHILCDNPEELTVNKLILWKRKDLCEATGLGRNFVNSTLKKLREVRAIAEVKTVNEGIVLHPNIVSRQRVTPTWDEIVDAIDNGLTKENFKK
ncbi:MarR family transcriptional regulator [Priestia megaterium]|uniref:MarR family transcriptional regulator n=1 Tax=Priestia megaterium TaxID=1404 RepID=UPI0030098E0F